MAWALTQSGFSASLAMFMTALPGGVPVFLIVTIIAFVTLGSVLEGIPAIVLFGPYFSQLRAKSACMKSTTQWSSFWRWELVFSPRPLGSATTQPAPSVGFIPTKAWARSLATL